MHLATLRHLIAQPLFGMTSAALKEYQQALCIAEVLQPLGMVAGSPGGFGVVTPATFQTTTLLIFAGMLRGPRTTIADRCWRLYSGQPAPLYRGEDAPPIDTAEAEDALIRNVGQCPVTQASRFGHAVARLLQMPELCERLAGLELVGEYAAGGLRWSDNTMTTFHCVDEKEERTRLQHMENGTRTTIAMLPGASLLKVAKMLDEDMSEAPPVRLRRPAGQPTKTADSLVKGE